MVLEKLDDFFKKNPEEIDGRIFWEIHGVIFRNDFTDLSTAFWGCLG